LGKAPGTIPKLFYVILAVLSTLFPEPKGDSLDECTQPLPRVYGNINNNRNWRQNNNNNNNNNHFNRNNNINSPECVDLTRDSGYNSTYHTNSSSTQQQPVSSNFRQKDRHPRYGNHHSQTFTNSQYRHNNGYQRYKNPRNSDQRDSSPSYNNNPAKRYRQI